VVGAIRMFSIAVMIIAVPVAIAADGLLNGGIDNGQGQRDIGGIGWHHTLAHELQEASIDDRTLVIGTATIGDSDRGAVVGVAVAIDTLEVVVTPKWPCIRECPVLHHGLPIIGGVVVERLAGGITVHPG